MSGACTFPDYGFAPAGGGTGNGGTAGSGSNGGTGGGGSGSTGGTSGTAGSAGDSSGGTAGEGGTAGNAGTGGGGIGGGGVAGTSGTGGDGGEGGMPVPLPVCADIDEVPECTCVDHDDHAYLFCNPVVMQTYSQASDSCGFSDMRLVRIDSSSENAWVKSEAAAQQVEYFWLGASSADSPGTWTWSDGDEFWQGDSSGSSVGGLYYQWRPGAPGSASTPYCGYMGSTGWDYDTCAESRDYVCEAY